MYPICASKEMCISIHFAAAVRNEWNAIFEVIPYRIHAVFFTRTLNGIGNDTDDMGSIGGTDSMLMLPGKAPRE